MANITRRNGTGSMPAMPFEGLVDNVIKSSLGRFFNDDDWGFNGNVSSSQVPVNIKETETSYELEVVAPGLNKQDFNVAIANNMLTVAFQHKEEDKQEGKNSGYLRHEYRMQSFSRNFTLDETIDAEKISAEYKNGVLHLSLPKKEGARISKNIEIK